MKFAQIRGVSLHFDYHAGHGIPLILLHEMGGNLHSWDLVLGHLPDCSYLRLDLRGFGLSEKPIGPVTLEDHVEDVLGLMAHLGIMQAHFVGGAVGAAVAIACAAKRGEMAASLTVFAPATGIPQTRKAAVLALADSLEQEGGQRIFLEQDTIPKAWPTALFERGAGFDLFCGSQFGTAPASLAVTYRMLAVMNLVPALACLKCPVHFVAGRHDVARRPDAVRAIAQTVHGAAFHEIESGHFMALQSPQLVADFLRF